jgi:hypothetical protein
MTIIFLRNKGNFEPGSGSTGEKFSAVDRKNNPWPEGLRKKSPLAASDRWRVEPLRAARSFWRISDFFQQRNTLELANSA